MPGTPSIPSVAPRWAKSAPTTAQCEIESHYHNYADQEAERRAKLGAVALGAGGPSLSTCAAPTGTYPFSSVRAGTDSALTFFFVDSSTLLPTVIDIPQVSSVEYLLNTNPFDESAFVSIGISMDTAANFTLPFTVPSGTPIILAIPYDSLGNPVFVEGLDPSDNVARAILPNLYAPELTSLHLGAIGLVLIALTKRSRRVVTRPAE